MSRPKMVTKPETHGKSPFERAADLTQRILAVPKVQALKTKKRKHRY